MKLYEEKQQSNEVFLRLTGNDKGGIDLYACTENGNSVAVILRITNEGKLKIISGLKSFLEHFGMKSDEFQYNALGGIALE